MIQSENTTDGNTH